MDVTDVLRDRMEAPSGIQGMVSLSLVLHAALIAVIVFAPGRFSPPVERPRDVMTISLSGTGEGAKTGGMTSAAPQAVQTAVPKETLSKREIPQAPAAATPEMTIPKVNARQTKARTQAVPAPADAKARVAANRGAETSTGPAVANTQARGQGFGLSTSGGQGTGSFVDVPDFCCPDYLVIMADRIRANWVQSHDATGVVMIRFTIQRSGQISDASIEKGSGTDSLDHAALRAILVTRSLPPLPDQFSYRILPVHLSFEYK